MLGLSAAEAIAVVASARSRANRRVMGGWIVMGRVFRAAVLMDLTQRHRVAEAQRYKRIFSQEAANSNGGRTSGTTQISKSAIALSQLFNALL